MTLTLSAAVLPLACVRRSRPPYRGAPPGRARVRLMCAAAAKVDDHEFSIAIEAGLDIHQVLMYTARRRGETQSS